MQDWNVILVDDEEEFVSTLAERLRLRGIPVRVTTDGEEALRMMETDPPQVVVLDVLMPGLGGLEVLKRIQADYPEVKVILLTGQGSTWDGIQGMRMGVFDYLMKPLNIDDLIGKIREAVGGG
ncbi:response regulator [Desulfoferrobacter suflitae]|uniref:response regulator n=1 Tax=Desulfoferrobacter suflitae TaxID=2865782 RepID=UPI00216450DC|nr:response regulator [Desulfoferrobacter suflitae]MCK8601589.1 response regulator [Desulfoferrobacter suflitae]